MYGHMRNSGIDQINDYAIALKRWEDTKPIRGRAEDVRPIGKRRRDWELLVKDTRADGVWYGARLYRTNVVMYSPDGRIEFRTGGWASVSTAEFMSAHSPFRATKTRGQVWYVQTVCPPWIHLLTPFTGLFCASF